MSAKRALAERRVPRGAEGRDTLEAIGAGERAFTAIAQRADVSNRTLENTLATLIDKRVIAKTLPYCAQPRPRLSRYHVSDPYLRFWLRFIRASVPALERGRGDVVHRSIRESWPSFAGRAIEPLVRGAIEALLPDPRFGGAEHVGGYWNRDGSMEIDLVGGRGQDRSERIDFVGTVKWREIDVGELNVIRSDTLAPKRTDVASEKSMPVTVTAVPPSEEPVAGLTAVDGRNRFAVGVKRRPKVFITDPGLAAWLTGKTASALADPADPATARLVETFVYTELYRQLTWAATEAGMFHWQDRSGAEVDFVLESPDGRIPRARSRPARPPNRSGSTGSRACATCSRTASWPE